MKFSSVFAAAAVTGVASADTTTSSEDLRTFSTIEPTASEIALQAENATTLQWSSDVKGKGFSRFFTIWLENTDYDKAADDPNMVELAKQGITLTNYWGVTHPSEPNYLASAGGDYFGLDSDNFSTMPKNVSSIADLLDSKGISWATYQEDMPYSGFQGFNYSNQKTFADDYVRKHHPLVLFDSVTGNSTRLGLLKNFTEFDNDLKAEKLPQYAFITPNMTNDGHDTSVKVAAQWSKDFITPLLSNDYFMNDTLVLLTFDENESYGIQNKVFSILLGGAIPDELKGTSDDTYYDHYSEISSVEAAFGLNHLGRNDVSANVFEVVANATNITNIKVDTTYKLNNESYQGYLNDANQVLLAPNVSATNLAGSSILPAISSVWASEYNAQVSESILTSTTTTVSGNITDVAPETTSSSSASASSSGSASGSASGSSTHSASSNSTGSGSSSSKAGAAVVSTSLVSAFLLLAANLLL
ncbi:DEKNAAC101915 [Brettanomyces naardenensis]|uniref:acid phosphatase n=1 Tax=Brettanomyces naardenensis TaxID=13370 RepID=A0A448YJK0_BRENA|nr:DEKNAAC101915 [Brettanomyces naardenensis]